MNIAPKYEDVVAQLEAALGREADLIASANQNKLMMDAACGEIATLQEEMAEFELVQQRLTVAEQLLREVLESGDWFRSALEFINGEGLEVRAKIEAALKPAAEGGGS